MFVNADLTADVLAETQHHRNVNLKVIVRMAYSASSIEYFKKGLD
jgi:hypothetical protein